MNRRLLMIMLIGVGLVSCSEKRASTKEAVTNSIHLLLDIPDKMVNKSKLFYDPKKSLWKLNGQLYSGHVVSYYQDSTLKEKFGVLNGKKQNQAICWHADGHYQFVSNYHSGKLNGDKKAWSSDSSHTLLSHLKYVSGRLHGEQRKWYPTGELFKKLNFNMGKEEGLQQAFRKNGALFANYEARKGRIFGLKKAVLCFSLEEEDIQMK